MEINLPALPLSILFFFVIHKKPEATLIRVERVERKEGGKINILKYFTVIGAEFEQSRIERLPVFPLFWKGFKLFLKTLLSDFTIR